MTLLEGKPSILVIDDSPDMLALLQVVLEMEYQVFTAGGGTEALETLSKIRRPKLILLDLQMQEMSGTDFLKILEEESPDIVKTVPIVFLTAMDEVPKSKAVGFIRKPMMDTGKFLESIQQFIEMGKND